MEHHQSDAPHLPGFGAGVMIETAEGPLPAEWLRVGDRVLTRDRGYQPVRWFGRSLPERAAPRVQIFSGGFGKRCPEHDLILSAHHLVLLRGPMVELHFATSEVLAPAGELANEAEIQTSEDAAPLYHFAFDHHDMVLAEGVWLDSLLTDRATLAALGPEAEAELRVVLGDGVNKARSARRRLAPGEAIVLQPRTAVAARRMAA